MAIQVEQTGSHITAILPPGFRLEIRGYNNYRFAIKNLRTGESVQISPNASYRTIAEAVDRLSPGQRLLPVPNRTRKTPDFSVYTGGCSRPAELSCNLATQWYLRNQLGTQ